MSAIALPLIHTTAADNLSLGVSPFVPAEDVKNISVVDVPAMESSKARFEIHFTILSTDNQPKTIVWRYSLSATRDADFALVVTALSAAI